MDNNEYQEQKNFLKQQLGWSKKQARILDEIDAKLHEMKEIAEYARDHKLSEHEVRHLNEQLNELKQEVRSLEKQLQSVIH